MKVRCCGFSIVELMVVLAILGILLGMSAWSLSRSDVRRASVQAAAEELAATCRQARALALNHKTTFAVVFHIQNDPASSGRVLNNRSGGHWYRILGPPPATLHEGNVNGRTSNTSDVDNLPPINGGRTSTGTVLENGPYTLFQTMESNELGWYGDVHVLPAKRVRFLALADMDYGDFTHAATARRPSATVSYPRPWFGWFDASDGRLYPWGGYDPAIPGSGFYFAGRATSYAPLDPTPTTATHTATRVLDHWVPNQLSSEAPRNPHKDTLYSAGDPRPLLDSRWRDCCLIFTSDGQVRWGSFMPGRHNSFFRGSASIVRGAAERCNGVYSYGGDLNQHVQTEVGNFDRDTGGWYLTLAPDVEHDQDRFPSAEAALDSLMPAYRVFVSSLGEVRIILVSRKSDFGGMAAFPSDESWWRSGTNMRTRFGQDRLVDGTRLDASSTGIGNVVGRPITDFLTPAMLENRSVWMQ